MAVFTLISERTRGAHATVVKSVGSDGGQFSSNGSSGYDAVLEVRAKGSCLSSCSGSDSTIVNGGRRSG